MNYDCTPVEFGRLIDGFLSCVELVNKLFKGKIDGCESHWLSYYTTVGLGIPDVENELHFFQKQLRNLPYCSNLEPIFAAHLAKGEELPRYFIVSLLTPKHCFKINDQRFR